MHLENLECYLLNYSVVVLKTKVLVSR